MGGAENPSLVPLLDLVNHDGGRAHFTSFDATTARVEGRVAARDLKAKRTTASGAREDVRAANHAADGDDWCLWSYDTAHSRPRALAAGDEVFASYAPGYDSVEWFCNTGFVPPAEARAS
mmetsp:Transcript_11732/g.34941  ORF Transcript_11732/g.34941 Transcript_11732/m.34941 type:complete len:120 (-) Transcript_11732:23-382(-)